MTLAATITALCNACLQAARAAKAAEAQAGQAKGSHAVALKLAALVAQAAINHLATPPSILPGK